MKRSISLALTALAALTLSACGQAADTDEATSSSQEPATAATAEAAAPAMASATRDDVIAALRCHAVLSSAMAANIVMEGQAGAAAGIREQTRWFAEAQRRATAAGIADADFNTLMAETRAPMTTSTQQAENRPLMERCLVETPAL